MSNIFFKKNITKATKNWKLFFKSPTKQARIIDRNTILISSTVENISEKSTQKYIKFLHQPNQNTKTSKFIPVGFPLQNTQILNFKISPSGDRIAILRKSASNEKEMVIEVMSKEKSIFSQSFSQLHGQIHPAPPLGGLSWNKAENKIIYTAESKRPEAKSFFDKTNEASPADIKSSYGDQNLAIEDWGEGMKGVSDTKLFLLDIALGKAFPLEFEGLSSENLCFGEPTFIPPKNGGDEEKFEKIAFVTYNPKPTRLGLYAHNIRQSTIYTAKIETDLQKSIAKGKEAEEINHADDFSASSPRPSPDGRFLAYFSAPKSKMHIVSMRLRLFDLETKNNCVLVDSQISPQNDDDFPGFYFFSQPDEIWGEKSDFMVVNTFVRSFPKIAKICLNGGEPSPLFSATNLKNVSILSFGEGEQSSQRFSDLKFNRLLFSSSSPASPPSMWQMDMRTSGLDEVENADEDLAKQCKLIGLKTRLFRIPMTHFDEKSTYEASLLWPGDVSSEKIPLIVALHGGPHGITPAVFIKSYAYLCSLGFAVLNVNFRGSIGFGHDFAKSTLGNKNDLQDVMDAINCAISTSDGKIDRGKIGVMGGSYGGYLSCMLIGEYPDAFKAAVALNPVTNLPVLSGTSDIPDWCYVESDLDWNRKTLIGQNEYSKMLEFSPISKVDQIKTPVMMVLGKEDARVPYLQNKAFIDHLKASGVNTRVLLYEKGNHSLATDVQMRSDVIVNTALWMMKHLGRDE